jgi:hypothetical protein
LVAYTTKMGSEVLPSFGLVATKLPFDKRQPPVLAGSHVVMLCGGCVREKERKGRGWEREA